MKKVNIKNILIILSSIAMILFVFCAMKTELRQCMGVPLMDEQEFQQIAKASVELGNIVCLEEKLVPYDDGSATIYLPCAVDNQTKFSDLEGQLTSRLPEYDLYFLRQEYFETMENSIVCGIPFTLIAIDENGNYGRYFVYFTTLPIVEIHGELSHIDDREREVYAGEVTIWEPNQKETGRLIVQSSQLQWHTRGFSSSSLPLPPLKLNLKEKSGKQNNLELFGFESDDDYLLNPMGYDDIYVREKLAMDLWNELADDKGSSLKMSQGEYCELIINGDYLGLRLVQNKIERSYLKLDEDDTLLKGKNVNRGTQKPPEEVYEVIYSTRDEETTFRAMGDVFYQTDFSKVNLENWIDLQLFLQFGNMVDNDVYKNLYYVIEREGEEESVSFVPWDTDMSFGICWTPDGFRLKEETVESINYRIEYDSLTAQYPEVEGMLAKRWIELRQTVLSEENIFGNLNEYYWELDRSGAISRDFNVLGWHTWSGEDTREAMAGYVEQRLKVLDEKYGAK